MGLHFMIEDLKTENLKLKKNVQANEVMDKESQTQGQEQTCSIKYEVGTLNEFWPLLIIV